MLGDSRHVFWLPARSLGPWSNFEIGVDRMPRSILNGASRSDSVTAARISGESVRSVFKYELWLAKRATRRILWTNGSENHRKQTHPNPRRSPTKNQRFATKRFSRRTLYLAARSPRRSPPVTLRPRERLPDAERAASVARSVFRLASLRMQAPAPGAIGGGRLGAGGSGRQRDEYRNPERLQCFRSAADPSFPSVLQASRVRPFFRRILSFPRGKLSNLCREGATIPSRR